MNLAPLRLLFHPNLGWLAVATAAILTLVGLLAIDTAVGGDPASGGAAWSLSGVALRQAVFIPIAFAAMMLTAAPHHRHIALLAVPLSIGILLLLVLLLVPGMPHAVVPVRNGAKRWIDLQFTQFQPSELAKIVFVIALAAYLRKRENYRTLKGLLPPLLIAFVPMGLILVEPDLGTALIFLPVLFAMLLAAGAKLKHLAAIILIGLSLMPAMYPLLQPHQKDRIQAILSQVRGDPRHRQDIGYQGYKARTLVGSGELTGYGGEQASVIVRFNALPEAHNDMIFAVIAARWGFAGAAAVIGLYMLFIASSLAVAGANRDPFARLIVVGVAAIVFTQMFVNIGMTIGLLPITGLTLPLISYGGSSLVTNFLMVGLVLNAAARRPMMMGRPYFEYDHRAAAA